MLKSECVSAEWVSSAWYMVCITQCWHKVWLHFSSRHVLLNDIRLKSVSSFCICIELRILIPTRRLRKFSIYINWWVEISNQRKEIWLLCFSIMLKYSCMLFFRFSNFLVFSQSRPFSLNNQFEEEEEEAGWKQVRGLTTYYTSYSITVLHHGSLLEGSILFYFNTKYLYNY